MGSMDDGAVFLEPRAEFDAFIVGVSSRGCVVYDQDQIILHLADRFSSDDVSKDDALEQAEEWFHFNIECAYLGEYTPIYVSRDYIIED